MGHSPDHVSLEQRIAQGNDQLRRFNDWVAETRILEEAVGDPPIQFNGSNELDRTVGSKLVRNVDVFTQHIGILSQPELEVLVWQFERFVERCDDSLLHHLATSMSDRVSSLIKSLLSSQEFLMNGIRIACQFFDSKLESNLDGQEWGPIYLDETGILDIVKLIAEDRESRWPPDAVAAARELLKP